MPNRPNQNNRNRGRGAPTPQAPLAKPVEEDFTKLAQLPTTYQAITNFWNERQGGDLYGLRVETMRRIEQITGRPLICYITKTHHVHVAEQMRDLVTDYIEDSDLTGIQDVIDSIDGPNIDVMIVSNGGSPETAERIVHLLRDKYESVRFIIPSNAYSAATLICFSGDEVIMTAQGTLGPVDPQLGGIPTRSILRSFDEIEKRIKDEGREAVLVYLPLIEKYDLHILQICKSAEELSEELTETWLSRYMYKCDPSDPRVAQATEFFTSYDDHKSHGRSINRSIARNYMKIVRSEDIGGLDPLVRSLYNQFEFFLEHSQFYKMFENRHNICWGRQIPVQIIQERRVQP